MKIEIENTFMNNPMCNIVSNVTGKASNDLSEIKAHLKKSCEHNEVIKNTKTLAEIIKDKKELIKLSEKEINEKDIDNVITGKNIFY